MKSTFFLALFACLFLSIPMQAQSVKRSAAAPTGGSSATIQYQVLNWTKNANIKIKGVAIRKNAVFSNTSDIKFSAPDQWVNTIKVGSSNQGYIFINDCSGGNCRTQKSPITVHRYKLETEDLRKLIKPEIVRDKVVRNR